MRIIVVDDKEEERYLSETLLKGSGYEVETAANGAEALEKLRTRGFDMIVSDVLMPVMDGFRLCRECNGDEKLKDIPFIFYTATYKDERDEELASKVGADKFIRKPIEPGEFVKIIQGVSRDVEKGKIGPKKRVLEEEREVLKLYSERLIEKLEKKMLDLEIEITERKRAEEALRESEEKLRLMFDSVTGGITASDLDGKITDLNTHVVHMHGYDNKEELIGRSAFELIAEKDHARAMENMKRALEDGFVKNVEYAFLTRDGREFPVELSAAVLKDASGKPTGFIAITEDITERKKMEEQLIVTDRLASIGELSSGIAHELNNPLTSVIGFSELLLDKDVPDDVKEDLRVINREAKRTAQVVRNLLTFARKHAPARQLVNINNIIQKVLELRAYEQKVNNIQVNTQFASDLPEITADGFQLQQVFLNIIINAEYFMTEAHNRGTLTITTERIGDIIRASFADDGPGIAKENLGHLFDPFFTTKEVGKGTGLGLSICHGIIAEHGGRIYAESQLSKGATFVVGLPISR